MSAETEVAQRIETIRANANYLKQHVDEIAFVYKHVRAHIGIVKTFVEIGAMAGASLYVYGGLLVRGGQVIAIDDGRRGWKTREHLKRALAMLHTKESIETFWVRGDSHAVNTKVQLLGLLGPNKIDFLHIDGDHSAAGSWQDWKDYGALVRPGGMIAFHDIRATAPCHVDETWQRICDEGALTRAICKGPFPKPTGNGTHKACGIGLVYV